MTTAPLRRHTLGSGRELGAGPWPVELQVLVVDDSRMNRKMMARLVASLGHACVEADDGTAAVALMSAALGGARGRFDVVLMDDQMPEMNGSVAARHMREMGYAGRVRTQGYCTTAVLLLCGYCMRIYIYVTLTLPVYGSVARRSSE